jgi:hypothetical protein
LDLAAVLVSPMKSSLSIIFIFFIGYLQAQDSDNNDIEKLIESSYLNQDNEIDYSELQTQHKNFKKANLNKIGAIEFHSMNLLNFNLIEEIIEHQKQYGPLKSKYELQTIDGLDSNAIIALSNAFEINNFSFQILITQKHQEFIRLKYSYRFEKALGFKLNDSNKFMGNRSKIGLLYHSESMNLDYGLHIEKDAGETEKMLFQSAYVLIKPKSKIQSILIGDQQINFAQGLSLGTGLTNGKSALVMQIMRNNVGCKPYKSFNETGFLRGLSIKKKLTENIEFNFFAGIRQLDANVRNDSNGYTYGSILNSGYYRNKKEQNSRHQLMQYLTGYHGLYKYQNLEIGSSLILHKIDLNPFYKNKEVETNKITGIKIGIDWKLHLRNNLVFGEITFNNGFKKSCILGLLRTLGKKTDLSLLYRRHAQNDDSKLSNGFGNTNENGFYLGISAQLPSKLNLCLYNDLSQFKQAKFRVDAPSFQSEQMIEIAYKTKNPFSIYFRYKHTERKLNSQNTEPIHSLDQHHKTVYRLHSEVKFEKVKIRTRLEFVKYAIENQSPSIGNLLYQDIQFNLNKEIDMSIRYSIFSSDDFNSRTFAYENDVPGTFNIPSYIGKGSRMYVLIKYQIQKDLQIWFRFARSSYVGIETNGSGLNLIESPHTSDLNIQLQWKF